MATTHSNFCKMFAIAMVAVASFTLNACGGGGGGNTDVACPAGQHHSTAIHTTTLDCVADVIPDGVPPTVAFTAPTDGSTVSSTANIMLAVSDSGSGIDQVDVTVKAAGASATKPVCTMATGSSYSCTWDSNSAANGANVLTATAKDKAGNTTSKSVTINVANVTVDTVCPAQKVKDLGNGQFKNCVRFGNVDATSALYLNNGACWAKVTNASVGSIIGDVPVDSMSYTSPATSGGSVSWPFAGGGTVTCQFK